MLKNIIGFGVELEGGWTNASYARLRSKIIHDGSVWVDNFNNGEIPSPVLKTKTQLKAFLKECYPDGVNNSCGMHCHISVKPSHYTLLMEPEFNWALEGFLKDVLINYLNGNDYQRLKNRMNGNNQYCRREFRPIEQAMQTSKYHDYRYYILNYCYKIHGTFELRVLPMVEKYQTALLILSQYLFFVDEYIQSNKNNCQKNFNDKIIIKTQKTKREVIKLCV